MNRSSLRRETQAETARTRRPSAHASGNVNPSDVTRWWRRRTPLEKVGVVAAGGAAFAVAGIVLFPQAAAAVTGGALASGGAYLLKKGFTK